MNTDRFTNHNHERMMEKNHETTAIVPFRDVTPNLSISTTTTTTNNEQTQLLLEAADNERNNDENDDHDDWLNNHDRRQENDEYDNDHDHHYDDDDNDNDDSNPLVSHRQQQHHDSSPSNYITKVFRRRYGSGLGNLGNTCFMNSTLQCLAHTPLLVKYFLTGEYIPDLNRKNPLGTGGELAVQFANLLAEMWGVQQTVRVHPNGVYPKYYEASQSSTSQYLLTTNATNVVYPKNFKYTLGKHAEQFMGYDQHDSQELATYLLDILHEDCNRVLSKPYIEKPEKQDEIGETDEQASAKAWALHKRREDSRILDFFMGQIKSRVQCCKPACGRVSTTFDPFLFLSVPIPGSSERTLTVTYVPRDPRNCALRLALRVPKSATADELVKNALIPALRKLGNRNYKIAIPLPDDVCFNDIWKKEVFAWLDPKVEIEKIRDNDETFVYELSPLAEIRQIEEQLASTASSRDEITAENLGIQSIKRIHHFTLDIATLTKFNRGDEWGKVLPLYLSTPNYFWNCFSPRNRGSSEERVRLYRRLVTFIEQCHRALDAVDSTEVPKRARAEDCMDTSMSSIGSGGGGHRVVTVSFKEDDKPLPEIIDVCDASQHFRNVRSKYDVAVLEFLAGKMFRETLRMEHEKREIFPNGIRIEIRIRRVTLHGKGDLIAAPFVLRIPSNMTVYGLRQELAYRMSRSLKTGSPIMDGDNHADVNCAQTPLHSPTHTETALTNGGSVGSSINKSFGSSPELWIIRQIPLSYERKGNNSSFVRQLGSISKPGSEPDGTLSNPFAEAEHEDERALISEIVGDMGCVNLDWPGVLAAEAFNVDEYQRVEDPIVDEGTGGQKKSVITVLDCIDKFCQKEQLEESEQWYCNKCQEHVCAWKQFHIYRSPPHLIVHLKRFQFSATTHRRQKISTFIDFPLVGLDLTDRVLHWTESEKPIYNCYAVSNHFGGLGGGHYTAHALNEDGVWCYYDDSRITERVDPAEVVSEAAYVLYYRRQDIPLSQDFDIQLQTTPPPEVRTSSSPPAAVSIVRDAPYGPSPKASVPITTPNALVLPTVVGTAVVEHEEEDTMDLELTDRSQSNNSSLGDGRTDDHYICDDDDDNSGGNVGLILTANNNPSHPDRFFDNDDSLPLQ